MVYAEYSTLVLWPEVSIMGIKSRKCAVICALAAVVGLYASAAWRVEVLRNQPAAHQHTTIMSAVR